MSFDALRASIEERMEDNWTDTPVAYENARFTPPNNAPWVRLQINFAEGRTMGLSGDGVSVSIRDNGLISMQLFVPENQGTAISKALVDDLIAIYEHTRFDGILAYTATPRPAGVSDGWHQTNITIPFRRVRNV